MKKASELYLLLLLFVIFIFLNCNNFWGYDYEADPIPNSATISGQITHFFTNKPVPDARLRFGSQSTLIDENGEYLLSYIFEGDEDRDKLVKIHVSADNYYSLSDSMKIFPQANHFDAKLKYAAPIIQQAVILDLGNADSLLCQAHITDYQGVQNISSAKISFYYLDESKKELSIENTLMNHHHSQNEWDFFYQLYYEPRDLSELPSVTFLELSGIIVHDLDGFTDSTTVNNFTADSTELLFSP